MARDQSDHGRGAAGRRADRRGRNDAADRGGGPADRRHPDRRRDDRDVAVWPSDSNELRDRKGEYEAALALGFLPREAALEVCRPVAGQALDQTRTVGLVTLPGAFVGVLLGGGSAVQAGATQLLVLIALLAAEAIVVGLTLELVAGGMLRRPVAP
ncbi:ABC transporter permease [Micromonospora sp. NPDC005197]|uniref:ABC transporter permease n=1 Tax=Micromonospora sp. NPDC005197 TaxID=3157020 RepID=UPI0033AD79B1